MKTRILLICTVAVCTWAQEATSGFALRTNLTAAGIFSKQLTKPPRSGEMASGALRAMLYPTWKLGKHWAVSGAVQVHTRPYFVEQFSTQGRGIRADVLQAHLSYSRFGNEGSVVFRAGQLSSAFGSFLLRYDDADNALIDMPLFYGYYYKGVTNYGMAGVQVDVTVKKVDMRAQLVNSSPANRRSLFDSDQYGNWAGGVGYTIVQGLRVGTSAYSGPYLHREHPYFRPGEAKPSELRASAVGFDVQWTRGYWSTHGEYHWFTRPYRMMPTFTQEGGYAEARRVLHPRWYVAARTGYLRSSVGATISSYETAAGFRPSRHQLIKAGYQIRLSASASGKPAGVFAIQIVTTLPSFSIASNR
jgi:hypothetical protein